MSVKAVNLRRGMAVDYRGGIWVAIDNQKIEKGKGNSFYQIQLKNVQTGQSIRERFRTNDQFEQVMLDKKSMEYLYSDASSHVVMDPDTYDQVELPGELIGDGKVYLVPNIRLEIAFVEGTPIIAELPNTVVLKVTDTPPQVKGATATNQLKDAVCEGGARVRVPPFVENGSEIKVDTRTGEYLSRA